jgi:hypothetical protein
MIEELRQHMLAGRLNTSEFDDRVGAVHRAATRGDLHAAMTDLPLSPTVGL